MSNGCMNTATNGVALCIEVDGASVFTELELPQHATDSEKMNCTMVYMTAALAASAQIVDIQARAITAGTSTVGGPKLVYAFEAVD